jgi:uncharacterized Zn-finger protein
LENTIKTNKVNITYVQKKDLPLSCPTPEQALWNQHPKVYLPIKEDNKVVTCPYCGSKYSLKS